MRVAVGSRNPVKLAPTGRAFGAVDQSVTFEAIAVDSGVSEQPVGDAETIQGATNRAGRAH